MTHGLLIETPGLSTIQDLGRHGLQAGGVPVSGALDRIGLRFANALAGNPQSTACLEIRILGPTIRVVGGPVRIALCNTTTRLELLSPAGTSVPPGESVTLEEGQRFRVPPTPDTACCYLAVFGGFELEAVLGSHSTFVPAGFGGFNGRPLQQGDVLPVRGSHQQDQRDRRLPRPFDYETGQPIRVVPGPQADAIGPSGHAEFHSAEFRISNDLSRMGVRLDGPQLTHAKGFNIDSDGIVTGSIQLPGSGHPIVLLADRQTTGGYPKIGTVISADIPRFARLRPGDAVRFQHIEVAAAEAARRQQEQAIAAHLAEISAISTAAPADALSAENLISGVYTGDD